MKPIIIGLHNPYSDNPENALAPYPENSSGHRLWKMLHLDGMEIKVSHAAMRASYDRRYYMAVVRRLNLFGTMFLTNSRSAAKNLASNLRDSISKEEEGTTVVLLGKTVLRAFKDAGVPLKSTLIHPQIHGGIIWRWLPHPSGRSTIYNDPAMCQLAGMMLADLITDEQESNSAEKQDR